jgi:DNA-binding transcriptional LysR family regulator
MAIFMRHLPCRCGQDARLPKMLGANFNKHNSHILIVIISKELWEADVKNATLRQLKVFETVSRHLSFTQAARELHLSQPAVSAQVKQLEELAGLALFEQLGKKVYLTRAGERMLEHSRAIIQQFRETDESMQELKGIAGGTLVVTVISAGDYFFPHLLAAFVRANPGVVLDLRVVNRAALLQQMEENRTDLGVMGRAPHDADIIAEPFAPHPYVIVAPPGHPLATRRNLGIADLLQEPFVVREEGSDTRHVMARAFGARMSRVRFVMEIRSNETVKQAVTAGMGLAFLSGHAVALELQMNRLVTLGVRGFPHTESWYVVHRRGKRLPPVANAFKEFLRRDGAAVIESITGIGARSHTVRRRRAKVR